MKLLSFVFSLLISVSTFADYREVKTFTNQTLNELVKSLTDEMNGSEMGDVFSYKLEIEAEDLNGEIETFLMDKYIDDVKAFATEEEDTDIIASVNNLNYYRLNTRNEFLRLENMMMTLELFLGYENSAELIKLDSQGYGSFGQASGFAVYIPSTKEMFILLSGYAE